MRSEHRVRLWIGRAASTLVVLLGVCAAPGCVTRFLTDDAAIAERVASAPPVTIGAMNGYHLIVMRAPNPGWSISLDATEQTPGGKRVYVTYREPDPALYYPQRIVLKRLLTRVRIETELELAGRVLDHDADAEDQPYAPLEPVESFNE